MAMEIRDVTDGKEWDTFVTSHPEANFLHSWQWGEFHLSRGRIVVRRGVYIGDVLEGAYEGVVERARRGTHLSIAGGPIVDWRNTDVVELLCDDMRQQGQEHGCVFVRVRPQLERSQESMELFERLDFRRAPMYLSVEHAGILDLSKSEEELLKGMRQRLRRALRKAEKNNISVETSTNPEDIKEFYQIQLQDFENRVCLLFED
jgi:alanine adding enzyme